jgi:4-amino-4-deoxy-L-arabinose transferase-like glycosyltransferase
MSQATRYQFWIVVAAGVIFFTNLGLPALFDMDEALYTTCAREMLGRHNWVVPWFNGELFPEKPPLMFWTMIGGFELFGVNEFGARFFSAVMGVGTALVAFHLGRILFNLRVGLWAGLITASTIVFTISARAATVDSALTFFTALAFLMFVLGWRKGSGVRGQGSGDTASNPQSLIPNPFPLPYAIASYAFIGVAVLGKGPVGMLLPLAAMGLFLLTINGWRKLFSCAWWMRPLTAIIVIAVVAAPWYIEVGRETQWEWPRRFFLDFNLRPFQTPIQGHGDTSSLHRFWGTLVSILYYFFQIPAVLIGFFPWSVFLGPTAIDAVRRLREGKRGKGENGEQPASEEAVRWRAGVLLALCWFGVWFVFWSVCKTKLFHYVLPAYPALALLTACFVDRWLAAEKGTAPEKQKGTGPICRNGPPGAAHELDQSPFAPPWALRNAWISTILVGVGIMIAIPLIAAKYLPGEEPLGQLGLLLVLGGAWCWWKTTRGLYQEAALTFAITSVAFLTAVFALASLRVDQFQNAQPVMAAICADEKSDANPHSPIATYRFFRESLVFYSGKPVMKCDGDDDAGRTARKALVRFFSKNRGRSYVITSASSSEDYVAELEKAFPDQLKMIYRAPRFMAEGEVVVFRHGE